MTDTLRDQLLGLGFKPAPAPARAPERSADRSQQRPGGGARADGGRPPNPNGRSDRNDRPARDPRHDRAGHRPAGNPAPRPAGAGRHGAPSAAAGDPRGPRRSHGQGQGQAGSGNASAGVGAPAGTAAPSNRPAGANATRRGGRKPHGPREDIDLAKAYAIRAQREKDERMDAERLKQEEAKLRREAKAKLLVLVEGKALNEKDADIARHFPYGGKIKRIYVTAPQLAELNSAKLGVLQLDGRYLLVDAALLAEAETLFPAAVALKVDPDAPADTADYSDPKFDVPDDLVW